MQWRSSRSRITSYENGIDDVQQVLKLNSQSGTQEVLKIRHKCFERGLD